MHIDHAPLLLDSLSSSNQSQDRLQPILQQDIPVFPQIVCNQNGPSRWKKCVYKIYTLNGGLCFPFEGIKPIPICLILFSTVVLAAHIGRSILCIEISLPLSTYTTKPPTGVCSTHHAIWGMLDVVLNIQFYILINIASCLFLYLIQPDDEAYTRYLMRIIQPLLDQNRLESAYTKICSSYENREPIKYNIRVYACSKILEKLLNMRFFDVVILDRLMLSSGDYDTPECLDSCFKMRVKKMYETNQDSKTILNIISGIRSEPKQAELLKSYALSLLERGNAIIAHAVFTATPFPKELSELVTDYVGTPLELAKMSTNYPLEAPAQQTVQNLSELQDLVNLMTPIIKRLAHQRLASLRNLTLLIPRTPLRNSLTSDPEVISVLHSLEQSFP